MDTKRNSWEFTGARGSSSEPPRAPVLRIGTRGSALARTQTDLVIAALREAWPDLQIEVQVIRTEGDRRLEVTPEKLGKGAFVKEIELALLRGEIDLAVHSCKDLPTDTVPELVLAAVPQRADPRDVLVSRGGLSLEQLPRGAVVGTSSSRRRAQLLMQRPDLEVRDIRGNVDTRLRKLREGQYDAVVLAAAGLARMGWLDQATEVLDPDVMLPAPGQGALAVQVRTDDETTRRLVAAIDHPPSHAAVLAERAFLRRLGGGCRVPIAAYAWVENGRLVLHGLVATPDGVVYMRGRREGTPEEAEAVGTALAEELLTQGAEALLERVSARSHAGTLNVQRANVQRATLQGKRVLVTRARSQADTLVERLRARGAEPVLFPTIRIVPVEDTGPVDRAIAQLEGYDWVIFTSQNAVAPFWERLRAAGKDAQALSGLRVGAIGPATAAALAARSVRAAFIPQQYVAEAILAEIGDVAGQRILLPRADIARQALVEGLRARGAEVDQVAVYRTVPADPPPEAWEALRSGRIDVITFTASSTVRNFVTLVEGRGLRGVLDGACIACIGPVTARTAEELGLRVDIVAQEHTIDGLVEAIVQWTNAQSPISNL